MDEECWEQSKALTNFILHPGMGHPELQTFAWIVYDQDNLYLAMKCIEPEPGKLKSEREHDGGIWKDDSVEVFLGPDGLTENYYHIIVNCTGTIYDSSRHGEKDDRGWESNAETGTSITEDAWFMEMRIPFSSLGKMPEARELWGLNLARNRIGARTELSTWSCTLGAFHNWWRFGLLQFAGEPPVSCDTLSIGEGFWGYNPLRIRLFNPSSISQSVDLHVSALPLAATGYAECKTISFRDQNTFDSVPIRQLKQHFLRTILRGFCMQFNEPSYGEML